MNSHPQFVIKNTFIELGDDCADEETFFLRRLRRIQTSPCQLCGMSSPASESDCTTSCGSEDATSDFSEPEEDLETEAAVDQAWETDSEEDISQVNPAANVAMPFAGMPFLMAMPGTFVPMVAVPAQPFQIGVHGDGLTDSASPKTTIMLRNLPNDYSREDVLEMLDSHGFKGLYDFFYLPVDYDRENGMGYAFVNLISQDHAEKAMACFEGFCDWTVNTPKVCAVSWGAPLQGREAHEERYRNSPVMHESVSDHFKPLIFEKGIRVPFPPPTKRIRAPRRAFQNRAPRRAFGGWY